jgi:Spy/CpxP family protein refolding chaperone
MVIFVCGVITGALVIETQGLHRSPSGPGGPSYGPPGPRPVFDIIRRMTQAHIELTTDQTNRIVKIMQDSQATNAAIRKTIAPLLRAEVERADKAINELLTPEQQPKFAELVKEQQRTGERRGGRGGEGGGRRGGEGGGRARNPNRGGTNEVAEGMRGSSTNGAPGTNVPSTNAP